MPEQKGDREQEAIGRSKGGLTIHATTDAVGNPTGFHLTPGQIHDLVGADALLPGLQAPRRQSLRCQRAGPLEQAGILPVIPSRSNRKTPRPYDAELYKARHLIVNFFAKLKQFRAIATRYDKRGQNFLAAIYLAAAVIWLN